MLIRRMTAQAVEKVARFESANFTQPWSKNAFIAALQSKDNILLVAEHDSEIIGYICMYVVLDEGEITNVAVAYSARGGGVGSLIMQEAFVCAAKVGVQRIVLEVRVSNEPAIGLYEKMGFKELGIRKGFYDMPKEDAYIMEYIVQKVGE